MNDREMPAAAMNAGQDESEMPGSAMDAQSLDGAAAQATGPATGEMPMSGTAGGSSGARQYLVELRLPSGIAEEATAASVGAAVESLDLPGMHADPEFAPVPLTPAPGGTAENGAAGLATANTVVVLATVDEDRVAELKQHPAVVDVFIDGHVEGFSVTAERADTAPPVEAPEETHGNAPFLKVTEAMATCPIGTCDCSPGTAKGAIADVAAYLGVDGIWGAGVDGGGIVVGVVDGGIRAAGRPIKQGESGAQLAHVIGGWPVATWGTTAAAWGDHGMMCGTDVLGMAPKAQLYDLRISDGSALSDALSAFQWAIERHRADGTPHVLTNSWGMFQESWAPDYVKNPNHPFTRKVIEAIDEGILVLFAAGNCGATCPDGRCGADNGPGRSIWGANGHERVITVGAVNVKEEFVGYSSQGPAALYADKPDFCSVTHFKGWFNSDSGTSAATPIAAGVVALMKQGAPGLTQQQAQSAIKSTAKDIGPAGFDRHSGAGILRAKAAYDKVARPAAWSGWESLGGFCTDGVGVSSWAPNRLDCFVVGNDRQLFHKWWDGGAWRGWEGLGGNLYSNPAAVSWGPNRIDVFALGGDHAMWHRWWDGSAWRGWESLGGFCTDGVGVSSWKPNRLDCFVVGNDRQLWHKWWDGSTWQGWEGLGGQLYSNPTAVSWGPNRIDVFALGGDHAMWHRWWDGSAWRGWESLGGFCTDGVGVSSWKPNRLDCFVVGNDRQIWHKWWDGSAWRGWEGLGGGLYSNPAAVSWGPNRIDVFALGGDHAMWHKWYA
jgi:subtilisin family serine protease